MKLPNELLVEIFLYLRPEDKLKCRLVNQIFNYLIDKVIPFGQQFTLENERNRSLIARKIRNLMISDIDINNIIYKYQLENYLDVGGLVEDIKSQWKKDYIGNMYIGWTRKNRSRTIDEKRILFYDRHKTMCLLAVEWIYLGLSRRFLRARRGEDLKKLCTFWGANYKWCDLCIRYNESPFQGYPNSKDFDNIMSCIPDWVNEELFKNKQYILPLINKNL